VKIVERPRARLPAVEKRTLAQTHSKHGKQVKFLKAIGHQDRALIVCSLFDGEWSVNELARKLGFQQPKVSRNLAILRSAGLVRSRGRGRNVFYISDKLLLCKAFQDFVDMTSRTAKQRLRMKLEH